MERATASV